MAVTVTNVRRSVYGTDRVVIADLVFSSNYAAGGESLPASALGLTNLFSISGAGGAAPATDRATADVWGYDYATSKVLFYQTGTAADGPLNQKGNEAYITGCSIRVLAIGN